MLMSKSAFKRWYRKHIGWADLPWHILYAQYKYAMTHSANIDALWFWKEKL